MPPNFLLFAAVSVKLCFVVSMVGFPLLAISFLTLEIRLRPYILLLQQVLNDLNLQALTASIQNDRTGFLQGYCFSLPF
jgi:hypothetical protein